MIGTRVGKLTVESEAGMSGKEKSWVFKCDCGNRFVGRLANQKRLPPEKQCCSKCRKETKKTPLPTNPDGLMPVPGSPNEYKVRVGDGHVLYTDSDSPDVPGYGITFFGGRRARLLVDWRTRADNIKTEFHNAIRAKILADDADSEESLSLLQSLPVWNRYCVLCLLPADHPVQPGNHRLQPGYVYIPSESISREFVPPLGDTRLFHVAVMEPGLSPPDPRVYSDAYTVVPDGVVSPPAGLTDKDSEDLYNKLLSVPPVQAAEIMDAMAPSVVGSIFNGPDGKWRTNTPVLFEALVKRRRELYPWPPVQGDVQT